MKNVQIKITGMSCASCAAAITHNLNKIKGIKECHINMATESAHIAYDERSIQLEKIIELIKGLGYGVKMPEKNGSAEDHQHVNTETAVLLRVFLFSIALGLPLFYITMGKTLLHLPQPGLSMEASIVIQLAITAIIMAVNYRLYISGLKKLWKRSPNMDSLIEIGTFAAFFYSVAISLLYWFRPEAAGDEHMYYESAAFILIFISLGKYLEAAAKGRTNQAIKKLLGLRPREATVLRQDIETRIPIEEVAVGDIVVVKPGEKIPVDGIVTEGYSSIDEKMITGEGIPTEKNINDEVIGGTINKTGNLKFQASRVGKFTMLAQIIRTVEQAMATRAPIQLLADRMAYYFVPAVIAISLLAFLIWIITGHSFVLALTAFISILIIACPCSLGLATPTAVMMGTGLAAQAGILIKSSSALEKAREVDTIVFDKTGTLTIGEPRVTDIQVLQNGFGGSSSADQECSAQNQDENTVYTPEECQILRLAASIEKKSEHPLAGAILARAQRENVELLDIENFQAVPGQGIEGSVRIQGRPLAILFGNRRLMAGNKIALTANIDNEIEEIEARGRTVMLLALDKEIIGLVAVADTAKAGAREAIEMLHRQGHKVIMITGDNFRVGRAIADDLGIDQVLAEILPQGKADEINKLRQAGHKVAMVGDGINDAPALASADIGIALGSGTDIAMEAGEIVLIRDDPRDVVKAIEISAYTLRKIKQNLFWAFAYNVLGIPIAAGILYPFTGWMLSPIIAAAAMAFSSVSVVSNSLSMKMHKFK